MTREDLLELATAFRDAAAEDLVDAQEPAHFHRATLRGHARLMQLEAQLFEDLKVRVDCKAGCGTCCHLAKVDARAHEVLALADWIRANFTPEEQAAVLERARAHAAGVAGLSLEEHLRTVRACPLLREMKCSAHPARPGACRIAHSTDVRVCERAYRNPQDLEAKGAHNSEAKLVMTVAADSSTFAFVEAGFDKLTYDLGSALAEALASDLPLERWLRREAAFSSSARAKQQA